MRSRRATAGFASLAALVCLVAGSPMPAAADASITAVVGTTTISSPMPPGFVGVSLEYNGLHAYTGRDPRNVNPPLIGLLSALAPGQQPVLRIGGNSADFSWWPIRRVIPPSGVRYALTPGWLRTTKALAQAVNARLIMGVNLAGDRPTLAAAEARAFLQGIGRQYLTALEIGNEPDLYSVYAWYRGKRGRLYYARSTSYSLSNYTREFSRWRAAMPTIETAGPALANGSWLGGLRRFVTAAPGLGVVTVHRYPLRAGVTDPHSPLYPSIKNLLSDQASAGLAQALAPAVAAAHARGLAFRVGEMNSASHSGQPGVSNAFASALWMLDTLFHLAAVGVDGVNVHTLPGAAYELFTFTHAQGTWEAFVHPEYYAMLMFAAAFPPGAQLLSVQAPAGPVKVWATTTPAGGGSVTRVVLINKDPVNSYQVELQVPGAQNALRASLVPLTAPGTAPASATSGVTLGGQSFGAATSTGILPLPVPDTVEPTGGSYSITLPPASALMLTQ